MRNRLFTPQRMYNGTQLVALGMVGGGIGLRYGVAEALTVCGFVMIALAIYSVERLRD